MTFFFPEHEGTGEGSSFETDLDANGSGLQLCIAHADELKGYIEERGLGEFISDNDLVAMVKITSMQIEGPTRQNFDPMLLAQFSIITAALSFTGKLLLFVQTHEVSICPICFLEKIHQEYGGERCGNNFQVWLRAAADEAKAAWDELVAEEDGSE